MVDIEALLWDMFYNGVLVGMLVGIGLSAWFWWMMKFADKILLKQYLNQIEPKMREEIIEKLDVLYEDVKDLADKTNTKIFRRWHNTLVEIDSHIRHKL